MASVLFPDRPLGETVTDSPTSQPTEASSTTNAPSSAPTTAPTTSSSTTNAPSSAPTTAPTTSSSGTNAPSSSPTTAPTAKFGDHIYVHAADIHGDGWGNDLVIAVTHNNAGNDPDRRLSETFEPEFYSLNCACKVIRIASA